MHGVTRRFRGGFRRGFTRTFISGNPCIWSKNMMTLLLDDLLRLSSYGFVDFQLWLLTEGLQKPSGLMNLMHKNVYKTIEYVFSAEKRWKPANDDEKMYLTDEKWNDSTDTVSLLSSKSQTRMILGTPAFRKRFEALFLRLPDRNLSGNPGQLWQIFNKDTNSRAHLHKVLDTRSFHRRAFLSAMPRPFRGMRSGLCGADALANVSMENACWSHWAARVRRFSGHFSPIKLFQAILKLVQD